MSGRLRLVIGMRALSVRLTSEAGRGGAAQDEVRYESTFWTKKRKARPAAVLARRVP
jgi:hypothetical protein